MRAFSRATYPPHYRSTVLGIRDVSSEAMHHLKAMLSAYLFQDLGSFSSGELT